MNNFGILSFSLCLVVCLSWPSFSERDPNENEMLLFPDIAFPLLTAPHQWKVMIHGWRYQTNDAKHLLEIAASNWIERLADQILDDDQIRSFNQSVKHERLRPFFVQENFNEIIEIRIGNVTRQIRTNTDGEFHETIDLTVEEIDALKREQKSGRILQYQAMGHDRKIFNGTVHLIEATGEISIISDIDDTIKISNVLDKVQLLTNTFILPFDAVPGMSALYRNWSNIYPNSTFHYLSAMPDQLYTLTEEFLFNQKFPSGSFHMRHFDWSLHSLFGFVHSQSTFDHKLRYLDLFFTHLRRRFILIGDSGEKDPEIYGIIARQYPESIEKIFIRAINDESPNDQRFLQAFYQIPREKWMIFNDPQQILSPQLKPKCCL